MTNEELGNELLMVRMQLGEMNVLVHLIEERVTRLEVLLDTPPEGDDK